VQVLQLIWGGRQRQLREPRTVAALDVLVTLGHLPAETGAALARAYAYLRDVEHKIQAMRDQQTQKLPEGELDQARLAVAMGYVDYSTFLAALDEHRHLVGEEFEAVIEAGAATSDQWRRVWGGAREALTDSLRQAGMEPAVELSERLAALKAQSERVSVDPAGRARLNALMPVLLAEVAQSAFAGAALARVLPLLEAVMRRSAYYVLLLENANALKQLVALCGASRWLAAELARHPALLDELLDERHLYQVPDRDGLRDDLAHRLAGVNDAEVALEALRSFKQGHEFRVAACELKGILPLMKISDYLTYIAEIILEQALQLAWSATLETTDGPSSGAFLIVGYGKLGGLELGPDSDLDMVFIHDLETRHSQFVNRMVRRLLNVLTTRTHSGALYEVDMRLRPSGRSGPMVSSLAAFEQYQRREAWTWEHQALVRARPVAGDRSLALRFDELRRRLLCEARDVETLRTSVVEMRERIERQAGAADLKRGAGGIVDIEFMVQYLVLAWAAEHPSLAVYTDNVRILETAADVGLLADDRAAALKQAYLALRAERHRAALDIPDDARAEKVLDAHRSTVRECWDDLLG
jgi:glutamate-ammonia-ligase adenylyltransferase